MSGSGTLTSEEQYTKFKDLGDSCFANHSYLAALRCYERCEHLSAYLNSAICHLKLGNPSAAVKSSTKVLSLHPCNVKCLNIRASAYKELKQYALCAQDLNALLKIDPGNEQAKDMLKQISILIHHILGSDSSSGSDCDIVDERPPPVRSGPNYHNTSTISNVQTHNAQPHSSNQLLDFANRQTSDSSNKQHKAFQIPYLTNYSKIDSSSSGPSNVANYDIYDNKQCCSDELPPEAEWVPMKNNGDKTKGSHSKYKPTGTTKDNHPDPIKGWIIGRIVAQKDKFSFLCPIQPLPSDYTKKDVMMFNDKISSSVLPVKKGDLVECVLGTKDKAKPFAMQAKVYVYHAERSEQEINDYFRLYKNMLCDRTTSQAVLVETLSASSQWYFLSNISTDNASYPTSLLALIIEVLKASTDSCFIEFLKPLIKIVLEGKVVKNLEKVDQDNSEAQSKLIMSFCEIVLSMIPTFLSLILPLINIIKSTPPYKEKVDFMYKLLVATQTGHHDNGNWKTLSQIPFAEELLGPTLERASTLRPIVLGKAYPNCEEYMDIYYRLMRTECFSAIQKGIMALKSGNLDSRDMNCFKDVYIAGYDVTGNKVQLALQFMPNKPVSDWKKTSQLMFGNLVCLTPNHQFTDPIWATVSNRDVDLLNKSAIICVEILDLHDKPLGETINILQANGGKTLMVESPNYFESFRSILKTLKLFDVSACALSEQFVFSVVGDIPEYQKKGSLPSEKLREVTKDLEEHQANAFHHCLTSPLGIIQGPPGTGKTFVGAKMVELLLEYKLDTPILILTYKNHALDEFLGKVLKFCDPKFVTRLGGQSKDPEIEKCLMKKQISQSDRIATYDINDQLKNLSDELSHIFERYDQFKYFTFESFVSQLADDQLEDFITNAGWNKRRHKRPGGAAVKQEWLKQQIGLIKAVCPLTDLLLGRIGSIDGVEVTFLLQLSVELFQSWLPSSKTLSDLLDLEKQNLITEMAVDDEDIDIDNHGEMIMSLDDADEDHIKEMEILRMSAISDKNKRNNLVIFEKIQAHKLKHSLFSTGDFPSWCNIDYSLKRCKDMWQLNDVQKYKLILTALKDAQSEFDTEFENCFNQITRLQAEKNLKSNQCKVATLARMKLIGATITGASIHSDILQLVAPKVVLVEEAAEILEPALLAALNPSLEQLIMIGDHKQLRPIVDTYYLTTEFKFDVSMMERLISTGFPYKALSRQGRMRPEFSALLKDIYPELEDFPGMEANRPPYPCISKSMFFWNHTFQEEKSRSVKNTKEACMAIALALFMIQNGAQPSQITIITAYLGQMKELRSQYRAAKQDKDTSKLFTNHPDKDVEIQTIDMYQGDENDYVIISLVRSHNNGKNIGFLNKESRRCVAQSRSKCGLYFIGNVNLLRKSPLWRTLIGKFEEKKCVGTKLPIKCEKHPTVYLVDQINKPPLPTDLMYFVNNPNSLCKVQCDADYPCLIPSHKCKKTCKPSHDHGYCKTKVTFKFPRCTHIGEKHCSKDPNLVECQVKVMAAFPSCCHKCEVFCFQTLKPLTCPEPCSSFTNCGQKHQCDQVCGDQHSHDVCNTMVFYKFEDCGHDAPRQKRCSQLINWKCKQKVTFYGNCGHPLSRNCTQTESAIVCDVPCTKTLSCGHVCKNLCGEPCGGKTCVVCQEALKNRIKEFKKQAEVELKELEKVQISVTRIDLDESSAEYSSVEDKTVKYIQPSHNWSPYVNRIEKVCNTDQQKNFQKAKMDGFGDYVDFKFHGTSDEGINGITKDGFRLPANSGMYGKGLYFATDSSKSAQEIYTKGSFKLLLCEVFLGDCYEIRDKSQRERFLVETTGTSSRSMIPKEKAYLKKKRKDSIFAPRGTEVRNDEFIVFDVRQAMPKYIIHYRLEGGLQVHRPPNPTGFRTHKFLITRNIDRSDPYYAEASLALAHFNRRPQDNNTNNEVQSVEIVQNTTLEKEFNAKQQEFASDTSINSKEILAYHGTAVNNVDSILKNNLDPNRPAIHGRAHGNGCYFSEFPAFSSGYGAVLIMFRVLPGNEYTGTGTIPRDFHSKKVGGDNDGYGQQLIISDSSQFLPAYVIHLK